MYSKDFLNARVQKLNGLKGKFVPKVKSFKILGRTDLLSHVRLQEALNLYLVIKEVRQS